MAIALILLFSVGSTICWYFSIRKPSTGMLALLGGTSGVVAMYSVDYFLTGHLDEFFVLSVIPVSALALVASSITAFVLSARLR